MKMVKEMMDIMKWFREEKREDRARITVLEPLVTESDVMSFFRKLDAEEMNVPAAMLVEWKLMAVEKMKNVESAEEFAFEQGRLAAYCEIEKMFLEMAEETRKSDAGRPFADGEEDEGDDA